ncbi:hypothetical protein BBOMB_1524 [Bifidobacterium bombi DSM 19703]|uniref:Uncharacterized protein n=1 Tax=Bifidobacterium bombi DSM 19703 TaxID=1341695 RepID=A0A086BNZ3_9BIFI|nr:hypothetical protein BBOMB_1524 [Bifidobacterium bombi DSM 19703]
MSGSTDDNACAHPGSMSSEIGLMCFCSMPTLYVPVSMLSEDRSASESWQRSARMFHFFSSHGADDGRRDVPEGVGACVPWSQALIHGGKDR